MCIAYPIPPEERVGIVRVSETNGPHRNERRAEKGGNIPTSKEETRRGYCDG